MNRDEILREILSDPEIIKKYKLNKDTLEKVKANGPYDNKIIEVLSVIINENDNHVSSGMIYNRLKKIHNI